jgi:anti-anti-sigma factor
VRKRKRRSLYDAVVEDTPYAAAHDTEAGLLTVSGSVDELSGPAFRADLEKATDQFSRDATVDLTGVDFFPSLAVGVLAVALKHARNAGLTLDVVAAPGSIVARVLTVSALPFRESP